uniref:G_PROTEIN_RECEP_F1_2 domain-containing protein n=1 Tax=Syphacia muris TaxID=451379 RepID=A0A0N5AG58_9BILA
MDEDIMKFGCLMTEFPEVSLFRLPLGIVLTVYIALAYGLQILVLIILTVLRKRLKIPIYKLMDQLNMSQIICMSSHITLVLPCTYTTCSFYSNTANILLTLPQILGHYTALAMNALIAIERISVFLFPPIHNFVERHSVLYTSAAWSVGCMIIILTTSTRCYKRYSPYTIRYTYECGNCEIFPGFTIMTFLLWFTEIMVAIMMLGYIMVLVAMKMKRHFHGSGIRFTSIDAQLASFLQCVQAFKSS